MAFLLPSNALWLEILLLQIDLQWIGRSRSSNKTLHDFNNLLIIAIDGKDLWGFFEDASL